MEHSQEMEFTFNGALLYAIQELTGKGASEIVAFFHDSAMVMLDAGTTYFRRHGTKRMVTTFPGTPLYFSLEVSNFRNKTYVAVRFPQSSKDKIKTSRENILQNNLESFVLGASETKFKNDFSKIPKKIIVDDSGPKLRPSKKKTPKGVALQHLPEELRIKLGL